MKLIVGLGNPGPQYKHTRHNIGFVLIDQLREEWGLEDFSENKKFHGQITQGLVQGKKIILLKPSTYMNRSGQSIAAVASYYHIDPTDILIIHDEIDFPTAKIALKIGGSHAGHNGLRDTINHLGTKDFRRLRIGVDRPTSKELVADYVLSHFPTQERIAIFDKYINIRTYCEEFLTNS